MNIKSLINTNPYLKDEAKRKKLIARSVRTSCGVEGIKPQNRVLPVEIIERKPRKIYHKPNRMKQVVS